MAVPVLTLKNLAQPFSRQRYGMVGCFVLVWTLREPQIGQQIPPGHRRATNPLLGGGFVRELIEEGHQRHPFAVVLPGCFSSHLCTVTLR